MQRLTLILIMLVMLTGMSLQAQDGDFSDGIVITLDTETGLLDDLRRNETLEILSRRLEAAGFSDYRLNALDTGEFTIDLPGATSSDLTDAFLDLLVRPGFVEFVDLSVLSMDETMALTDESVVTDVQLERNPDIDAPDEIYPTILTGENLAYVEPQSESGAGGVDSILALLSGESISDTDARWFVLLEFDDEGATILEAYSSANIGSAMGIVIDGVLLSAPTLQTTLTDSAIISGNFSADDAIVLAGQLSTGALPVPLTISRINTYTAYQPAPNTE